MHVGINKTGSSSIQQTLCEKRNNKLLEAKNFIYPRDWRPNHSIPVYIAFCDHPEKYHISIKKGYSITEIKEINNRNLKKLETEIVERKRSKLIISGEDISVLSHENIKALKKYIMSLSRNEVKIRILIYVRNPITWSVSAIQQRIKSGGHTYQNCLKGIRVGLPNLFRNRIDKFVQVFGKDSVEVYSFEEAISHKFGLVGHFLSSLGLNSNEISQFNRIRVNESISLIAGELLSFINEKMPLIKGGKLHEERSGHDFRPFLNIKGPKFDIPYSVKKELFDSCQDDIHWLKEKYGIDYSNFPQVKEINYEITHKTIKEIKNVYDNPKLSIPLKTLIIEYLQKQLKDNKNSINDKGALLIEELLEELNS